MVCNETTLEEIAYVLHRVIALTLNAIKYRQLALGQITEASILSIHASNISSLVPVIKSFKSICYLNISYNDKLSEIPPNLFEHMKGIEQLDITGNQIKIISDFSFHGLSSLTYLDLSNQNI